MIHKTAEVQTTNIGENTNIWQFCVVLPGAQIGSGCNINAQVFIENEVKIGDRVTVKSGVQIWDGITINDDVFIGPNVTFTNDIIPRSKHYPESFEKTMIEQGASIGANATIIAGITIGRYAFIGAGSVLTKSINPFTLWYGNPAKHNGYITKEGVILNLSLQDKTDKQYQLINEEPLIK